MNVLSSSRATIYVSNRPPLIPRQRGGKRAETDEKVNLLPSYIEIPKVLLQGWARVTLYRRWFVARSRRTLVSSSLTLRCTTATTARFTSSRVILRLCRLLVKTSLPHTEAQK